MKQNKISVFTSVLFIVLALFMANGFALANSAADDVLAKKIDSFLSKRFPAGEPGVAVLAVKDGKTILRKGYGMANLELGIRIKPESVFRIGSITKQFTAAAIMKLVEQGKISLQDEITKFIPGYPVKGNKITVHHLLNHTSGIKSYTGMPNFFDTVRQDFATMEMVDRFKNQPMDFKTGDDYRYNNSGYFLLGAIIEKVTGKSYAKYVDEAIFKPLGLKNTYYGSHSRIIPNRVDGYKPDGDGFLNADYLSMTQPHAAGSIISTVDDLYKWNTAMHSGKVVSEKSFKLMTTPTKLNNGKTRDYGYGLSLGKLFDEPIVAHGGGINGFSTMGLRIPGKNVFVAVFSNCPGKQPDPSFTSQWIAGLLCGKDVKERKAIKLDHKTLDQIVGVYKISDKETRTITREGDQLFSLRSGSRLLKVFAESKDLYFYENSFSYFTVVRDKKGKVTKMVMHSLGGKEEAVKTDKKPVKRKPVKMENAVFDAYAGEYTDDKGMGITLKRDKNRFFAEPKGSRTFEIFPESRTKFFLKEMDARIEIKKDDKGKVVGLTLFMQNQTIHLKKQ